MLVPAPSEWLKIASFRRRAITVLLVHISSVLAVLFYIGYWWLFTVIPSTYQPILAIFLPIIREGFGLLMSALGKRSSGGDIPSVELIAGNIVALFHVLFLSSCIGSIATKMTTYILLGTDFLINIFFTFRVYRHHKNNQVDNCGETLMTLVLNESIEFIVPLTFLICFLVSFYGGNRNVIGKSSRVMRKTDLLGPETRYKDPTKHVYYFSLLKFPWSVCQSFKF